MSATPPEPQQDLLQLTDELLEQTAALKRQWIDLARSVGAEIEEPESPEPQEPSGGGNQGGGNVTPVPDDSLEPPSGGVTPGGGNG